MRGGRWMITTVLAFAARVASAHASATTSAPRHPLSPLGCVTPTDARRFFDHYLAAFNARDWEAFRATLDDSISVLFDTPAPPERMDGRAAVEALFRRVLPPPGSNVPPPPPMVPRHLRAQDYGDVVVISFETADDPNAARRTVVMHRGASGRRVVHIHRVLTGVMRPSSCRRSPSSPRGRGTDPHARGTLSEARRGTRPAVGGTEQAGAPIMTLGRELQWLVLAAVGELLGCSLLAVAPPESPGVARPLEARELAVFALSLARVPMTYAGRTFASYGGICETAALAWLVVVERAAPTRWDWLGVSLCLAGTVVSCWGVADPALASLPK